MTTMRAAVFNRDGDSAMRLISDAQQPTLQPGQALLQVLKAGVCNTDLELVAGYMGFAGILGHEFVARVVDGPAEWQGKRVVGEINVADGSCDFCQRGIPSQCRDRTTVGIDRHDGAFADYLALSTANLQEVPDAVSDDAAVFVEPLAAALQITEAVHISPRDRVVVIGAGKLGMLAAQVLHLTGADLKVIVRREKQTALLTKWGIDAVSRDEVENRRAQVVVDCTGTAEGFAESLDLVEPRGTIVLKSTYRGVPQADLTRVAVDEIQIVGSRCGPFDAALRLLKAGLVDVESLIEARYSLDAVMQAFEHAGRKGALKVMLDIASG